MTSIATKKLGELYEQAPVDSIEQRRFWESLEIRKFVDARETFGFHTKMSLMNIAARTFEQGMKVRTSRLWHEARGLDFDENSVS